jgi:hypothetical protein
MKPVIFRDEHVFVYIVMIIYGKWIYSIYIYTVYSNGICHGDRKKKSSIMEISQGQFGIKRDIWQCGSKKVLLLFLCERLRIVNGVLYELKTHPWKAEWSSVLNQNHWLSHGYLMMCIYETIQYNVGCLIVIPPLIFFLRGGSTFL